MKVQLRFQVHRSAITFSWKLLNKFDDDIAVRASFPYPAELKLHLHINFYLIDSEWKLDRKFRLQLDQRSAIKLIMLNEKHCKSNFSTFSSPAQVFWPPTWCRSWVSSFKPSCIERSLIILQKSTILSATRCASSMNSKSFVSSSSAVLASHFPLCRRQHHHLSQNITN